MTVETVFAAGGVLYRAGDAGVEVMLILRRGVWDLPKGGQETGEVLSETAVREVMEELGTSKPVLEDFLLETMHEYDYEGRHYIKRTAWYAMRPTSETFIPQELEAIEACVWTPLEASVSKVAFENLKLPLEALRKRLK